MSADRRVPSRELDAEVARALGWTDVSYGPVYWMKQSDWRGFPPHETMMIAAIPAYTTAPEWDSACWGEMMAWLKPHGCGVRIQIYEVSSYLVEIYRPWGFFREDTTSLVSDHSIGHALARAILAVADWERKETSNE